MKSKLLLPALAASAVILASTPPAHAGLFDRLKILVTGFQSTYKDLELPVIGKINADDGAPLGHGTIAMVQGRLAIVFAPDSGRRGGGFAFLDLDLSNPNKPAVKLVHQEKHENIREGHGFGFHMQGKSTYAALQTINGIQI